MLFVVDSRPSDTQYIDMYMLDCICVRYQYNMGLYVREYVRESCVWICVCIYVCVSVCAYPYLCICIRTCVYVCLCIHVCSVYIDRALPVLLVVTLCFGPYHMQRNVAILTKAPGTTQPWFSVGSCWCDTEGQW
jgi:hypothetical protein